MSVYLLNKICYLVQHDVELRERLRSDPAAALSGWALSPEERRDLVEGDVAALYRRGVHPVLLVRLQVHGIAGLTEERYSEAIRGCAGDRARTEDTQGLPAPAPEAAGEREARTTNPPGTEWAQ